MEVLMRRFFKGLWGVVLGGSFGEETVIDVLAGHGGQRMATLFLF